MQPRQVKTLLVGIPLPAEKTQLLEYAVRQRAEPQLIDVLRSLPDRRYESLDEVVEELLRVQPGRNGGPPHEASSGDLGGVESG
jgi:hypothetical protein